MKKILLIVCIAAAAVSYGEGLIFADDEAYKYIEFLSKTGYLDIETGSLPIQESEVSKSIEKEAWDLAESKENPSEPVKYLFRSLKRVLNREGLFYDRADVSYSLSNGAGFKNRANLRGNAGNLVFHSEFVTDYPYSDTLNAIEWKGTASRMQNGYIGFVWSSGYIAAGRFLPAWGEGVFDNMFISGKIKHPDGLLFEIKRGRFGFSYYATVLSEYTYLERITHRKRFVNMHRLYAELPLKTYFSFKEAVIYSSGAVEPYYLNPALFYYITQWNSDNDDNILWSVELKNRILKGVSISAEYFIDDFQYDSDYEDYNPNKTAFLVSVSYAPSFAGNLLFEAEYAMAEKYTGTHEFADMTYSYYDRPLFYFTGPDADLAGVRITFTPLAGLMLRLDGTRIRNGEGDLSISWESQRPITKPDFPSGVIETTYSAASSAEYEINGTFTASAAIGFSSVANAGNTEGESSQSVDLKISLEVRI